MKTVKNNTTSPDIQQGVDAVLREQTRARNKALLDYYNDIAVAKEQERQRIYQKLKENGMSDEDIQNLLSDD